MPSPWLCGAVCVFLIGCMIVDAVLLAMGVAG